MKYFTKQDVMRYFNPNYTSFATLVKMKLFGLKNINDFIDCYDEAYTSIKNYLLNRDTMGIDEKYQDDPQAISGLREMSLFLTTPDVYRTFIKLADDGNSKVLENLSNPYESFQYWLVNYGKFGKDDLIRSFRMIDKELKPALEGKRKPEVMYKLLRG